MHFYRWKCCTRVCGKCVSSSFRWFFESMRPRWPKSDQIYKAAEPKSTPPAAEPKSTPPAAEPKSDQIYKDFSLGKALFGWPTGWPAGLGSRLCRYLRQTRSLLPCLGRLGKRILSLFTVSALTFAMLGKAWRGFCRYLR